MTANVIARSRRRPRRSRVASMRGAYRLRATLAGERRPILLDAVRAMPPERRDPCQPTTHDVAARGARIRFVEAGSGRAAHPRARLPREPRRLGRRPARPRRRASGSSRPTCRASARARSRRRAATATTSRPSPSRWSISSPRVGLGRVSLCGHAHGRRRRPHARGHARRTSSTSWCSSIRSSTRRGPTRSRASSACRSSAPSFSSSSTGARSSAAASGGDGPDAEDGIASRRVDHLFELFDVPAAREAAYATMHAMLDTRPLTASVPRVKAPTLVAWGRANRASPVEQGRRLARELGGARFEVFDCGPSPAEECPEAFAERRHLVSRERHGGLARARRARRRARVS